ncbi:cAMP-dependent protein kinase type II regulatory subunit-like, partial [Sipha flava]
NVRDVLVFRSLDAEQMAAVIDTMFEREVRANDVVIRQGDKADNFYVVEHGTYEARIAEDHRDGPLVERVVRTYAGAGSFGELALLYNMPRAATVVAKTDGVLWVMDRRTFGRVVRKTACDRRELFDRLIGSVPMLDALQPYERMNLSDALEPRYYRHGELVFGQGGPGDGMYFVMRGAVAVHVTDRVGVRARVNTVAEGGYFGELALITDNGRAASVYAVGDVKLAFLDVGAFERLLGPCLDIMKRNSELYEQQLAAAFGTDRVP